VASLDSNTLLPAAQLTKLQDQPLGWFNVEDYGAVHNGVADDTAAIQAAINAAFANGGGVVYFPLPAPGQDYVIAGALQTSVNGTNPNSQLYIPLTRFGIDAGCHIELVGETRPNFMVNQVSGGINDVTNTVVLRSTITGGGTLPAVFGTPTYTGIFSNRNHTYVTFRNLRIKTRTNTGSTHFAGLMSGINFARLASFCCDYVSVETTSTLAVMAEPTNETYGIIFPEELNFAMLNVTTVRVLGYKYGLVPGEHFTAQNIFIGWCKNGIYLKNPQQHGQHIQRLSVEATTRMITMAETNWIEIGQFAPETVDSVFPSWCWTEYHLYYTGGNSIVGIDLLTIGYANVGGNLYDFKTNNYGKASARIINGRDVYRDIVSVSISGTWRAFHHKKAKVSLTGNATITISEAVAGDVLHLFYKQDGTGGKTLTINGTSVTITSSANAAGYVQCMYDGTDWVYKH
jgi:hypothetical protein